MFADQFTVQWSSLRHTNSAVDRPGSGTLALPMGLNAHLRLKLFTGLLLLMLGSRSLNKFHFAGMDEELQGREQFRDWSMQLAMPYSGATLGRIPNDSWVAICLRGRVYSAKDSPLIQSPSLRPLCTNASTLSTVETMLCSSNFAANKMAFECGSFRRS